MDTFLIETARLTLELIVNTVPMMVAGVLIAEYLMAIGVADKISSIARPLTSFSHLNGKCGLSFIMAFVSPRAANTMLVDFFEKRIITRPEMIIASLMNSFPTIMMHWRYLLPVYVPLLGMTGMIYFLILMVVGFFKTALVMLYGRFTLDEPVVTALPVEQKSVKTEEAVRTTLKSSGKTLKKILLITIPTLFVVSGLISAGVFDLLAEAMQGISGLFPVPPVGIGIIAAQFGSFIAGAGVASTLLAAGDITSKEVIITLLVGNILTSVTRSLRWFGSSYAAIFGPKTGAEIMGISVILRNGLMIIIVFLLALIW